MLARAFIAPAASIPKIQNPDKQQSQFSTFWRIELKIQVIHAVCVIELKQYLDHCWYIIYTPF